MKKKIFALIIAVAVVSTFGLTACGHKHDYKATVVAPTCTEQGYTLYECECGDSYKDSYTDAKGHSYVNGVCINCGEDVTTDYGFKYTLNDDGESYTVTAAGKVEGNMVVPATIKNMRVTIIGNNAFRWCSGLTSITISNSVTSIGDYAFVGCSSLTSLTIPDGVTEIGNGAFIGCSGLTSIAIPNSVTAISEKEFRGCSGLETITVEANNANYKSENNCILTKDGKTLIFGCKNSIIPDSVTSISSFAFYYCSGLTSITIPDGVTEIGTGAFVGCSGLTSINIPDSVTSISGYAFMGCSRLTSITIPNSVTTIGWDAFYNCSSLTSITIPNSVTSIGSYAFYKCSGLSNVTIGNSVTTIGNSAFIGCSGLTDINYNGTKEQWEAISKGDNWDYNTGNYTVHCTDGDIAK